MNFIKQQARPNYRPDIFEVKKELETAAADEEYDEMYDQAVAIVTETQQASISMIQRRLRVGYNRAARMVEQMERDGVVGPADGAKPREVYARRIEA
jgi:S-DNA-T family DNA segregation ATPase FtsK/SpoIIIE